jgi:hypothetical protein
MTQLPNILDFNELLDINNSQKKICKISLPIETFKYNIEIYNSNNDKIMYNLEYELLNQSKYIFFDMEPNVQYFVKLNVVFRIITEQQNIDKNLSFTKFFSFKSDNNEDLYYSSSNIEDLFNRNNNENVKIINEEDNELKFESDISEFEISENELEDELKEELIFEGKMVEKNIENKDLEDELENFEKENNIEVSLNLKDNIETVIDKK